MPQLPTIAFIPGAWHKPLCYTKVISLLESHYSIKCISITLPSTLGDPNVTFKDDLDAARKAISGETSQGRDVIIVAHSYGGMIGNSAIKGFARTLENNNHSTTPTSTLRTGYVVALVLISSGFALDGVAFMDPLFGRPPPAWRINSATGFADLAIPPPKPFYHDLPAEEAEYWTSELSTQSLRAFFEGREFVYGGWRDVPVWYLGTSEDAAFPVFAQRMGVGAAKAMGGVVYHRELQSSHSPFLSLPQETVGVLVEAVEKITGEVLKTGKEGGKGRAEVVVPMASIWRPRSWMRFGLPLMFGHMVGRMYLLFQWGRRLWRS